MQAKTIFVKQESDSCQEQFGLKKRMQRQKESGEKGELVGSAKKNNTNNKNELFARQRKVVAFTQHLALVAVVAFQHVMAHVTLELAGHVVLLVVLLFV